MARRDSTGRVRLSLAGGDSIWVQMDAILSVLPPEEAAAAKEAAKAAQKAKVTSAVAWVQKAKVTLMERWPPWTVLLLQIWQKALKPLIRLLMLLMLLRLMPRLMMRLPTTSFKC